MSKFLKQILMTQHTTQLSKKKKIPSGNEQQIEANIPGRVSGGAPPEKAERWGAAPKAA